MLTIYNEIIAYDLEQVPLNTLLLNVIEKHVKENYGGDLKELSELHHFVSASNLDALYQDIYAFFRKPEFQSIFGKLGRHIVDTYFEGSGEFQRIPSIRLHLPGLKTVQYHTDEWYGHGHNFGICWVPLVDVSDTNSMYVTDLDTSARVLAEVEKENLSVKEINDRLSAVCEPLELHPGQAYLFNAHLVHGAECNTTDKTRVSFDFRIRPSGEVGGLKSDDFFVSPDKFDAEVNAPQTKRPVGIAYVNMHEGFTKHISQKIQQLMCFQYADEKSISILTAETEIVTMSHYPMLFDLLEGSEGRECDEILFFSVLLLPKDSNTRAKVFELARKRGIALAFVAEGCTFPAGGTAEDEAAIQRVRTEMLSGSK